MIGIPPKGDWEEFSMRSLRNPKWLVDACRDAWSMAMSTLVRTVLLDFMKPRRICSRHWEERRQVPVGLARIWGFTRTGCVTTRAADVGANLASCDVCLARPRFFRERVGGFRVTSARCMEGLVPLCTITWENKLDILGCQSNRRIWGQRKRPFSSVQDAHSS